MKRSPTFTGDDWRSMVGTGFPTCPRSESDAATGLIGGSAISAFRSGRSPDPKGVKQHSLGQPTRRTAGRAARGKGTGSGRALKGLYNPRLCNPVRAGRLFAAPPRAALASLGCPGLCCLPPSGATGKARAIEHALPKSGDIGYATRAAGLILLLLLLTPTTFADWTARGSHLLKDGKPRLLLAISDLEPTQERLVAYGRAGFDAVWVRSLLNDTPEGIAETLSRAEKAALPLIGGLPIGNLKHLEPGRIKRYASSPGVLAWVLSTGDKTILEASLAADQSRLFLLPAQPEEDLPDRTVAYSGGVHPRAGAPDSRPRVVYVNIHETSDDAALRLLTCLATGADGLTFSVNYKGVLIGEGRVNWLRPKLQVLREFHASVISQPVQWQAVQVEAKGTEALKAATAAGPFLHAKGEAKSSLDVSKLAAGLVVYHKPKDTSVKDGVVTFEKPGEIWFGPKQWRDRMLAKREKPAPETAATAKHDLESIQSRIEARFEYCAKVFARLSRAQLERHVPALLPYFRKYYGEPIAPLSELKSADGKAMELADLAVAGAAEELTEGKRETDNLGTGGLTGDSDLPLKRRILKFVSKEEGADTIETLLGDLRSLEDAFLNACLRWESEAGPDNNMALQTIGDSDLGGGIYLLNLSDEPVELCMADSSQTKEYSVSWLLPSNSAPDMKPILQKMKAAPGIQPFGKTIAVNYTQGYTVVIPPGTRRELLVSKSDRGQFHYVPLNRNQSWRSLGWERTAAEPEAEHQPGLGTHTYVEPRNAEPLTIWQGELWRPLDLFELPPEDRTPLRELKTHLYRGEWQTVGFSVHNPNDEPAAFLAWPDFPLECTLMAYAYTRAQLWTLYHGSDVMLDLRFSPPDRPIPEGPTNGNLIYLNRMGEVWIPPRQTRQMFVIFKTDRETKPDTYSGALQLVDPLLGKRIQSIGLEVKVWPMALPPRTSFRGTGYTIGSAIYWPKNAQDAFDHYFNLLSIPGKTPGVTIDWENEEITVDETIDVEGDSDFLGAQRLAKMGFGFLLSGWGATGMKFKGGIAGSVDEAVRQQQAAADGKEAKSALEKMGKDLTGAEEEGGEEDEIDLDEDDDEEKPKDEAKLLREKAERLKKKYWPGTPGYEKLTREIYKRAMDFHLANGFAAEQLISYVWDEAPTSFFPSVVRMAKLMKEVHPNIRTYVTCLGDYTGVPTDGAVDIFSPHMGFVYDVGAGVDRVGHAVPGEGRNRRSLHHYRTHGKEVWCYMQHSGYLQGKHAVDYPMGLLWRAWQMNLRGFGLFSIRNCRGDLGYYPTKCYEAWREGVEDLLAMQALEADLERARKQGLDLKLITDAETALRERSQEVLGAQWWWSDRSRRYRLIRSARLTIAEAHLKIADELQRGKE